ncbi:replication initiation negative regulator SeqA [Candidatus Williamhamiltonella defendens]|uniref:Negative modulator of initiation of replication n=1 Tax=Candidatus Hamiltonella defensa (Bemisia tabaci) TaxID=672795 RepID=A0A249DYX3_9ENTR|nr:replication initiation negative regulator SeqA [Candidatus Hamiltonella defensa]ASX26743.1 replication initiation regulator SeqA [Candidatus Hamiltonella defensa (Bemisia tabaci)]CED78852.1 Negative modulator of initiation of replication [Candidatus Hamiltonella defensa (Bemisia tabaci)]
MKLIEVDEELYRYIASHTQYIGESASEILRRMFSLTQKKQTEIKIKKTPKIHQSSVKATLFSRIQILNDILSSETYTSKNKVIARFMLILSTLYDLDSEAFSVAAESLQGRKRAYFSGSKNFLLKNGTHTKPKQIPKTPYWVITNTNSERKRTMLKNMMTAMKFPNEIAKKVSQTI